MIAKIAVAAATFAIDKPWSYFFHQDMALVPGMRVSVPFGQGNRRTEGVVLSVETGSEEGLKPVERCLDAQPLITEAQLRLAAFLRERYFCTFFDAVRAMLPAGLWFQTKSIYRLTEDRTWQDKPPKQPDALQLLRLLDSLGGQAEESAVKALIADEQARESALRYLLRKKWLVDDRSYRRKTNDKTERIAMLVSSAEEAMEFAAKRPKSASLQRSVLQLMCAVGSVSVKELCYYTGASAATVNRLEKLGYIALTERPVLRCSQIEPARLDGPLTLNGEQQRAFDGLSAQMQQPDPGIALLYGVTGSGKTAVYLKLIQRCLEQEKAALLMVPEIALTPQLLSLLVAHFGKSVAVLHSSLAPAERYDQWKRVRDGEARVIVGTRSAVFAPSSQLGLIIVDEEQEHSYKSENNPRYSAKEVAIFRGAKEQALVLLGSATPSVETMYHAKNGDYRLYKLQNRFNGRKLPDVHIVDMRQDIQNGNDYPFSIALRDAIMDTHAAGKQTILFLNRRGNSRSLQCVQCGEAPECPRCSERLTYHSANERVMCHYCGYSQIAPRRCRCGGSLKRVGTGTQKLQQQLQEVFEDLEIVRMDADTVNAVNTHEKILTHFKEDHVPVLIGTQMVAKGLNLPDVTLVGVLDADMSLYGVSFRAAETTFNMLTQVVGRAGRGDSAGQAVIQTMVPEHPVIMLAAKQDYDGFYDLELQMRRVQKCPPFADIAAITILGQEEAQVLQGAAILRTSLKDCLQSPQYSGQEYQVLGPAPCAVPKINYNFRYRITLRCKMNRQIRQLLAHLLRQFMKDRKNKGLTAFVDVNGFEE